VIRFDRRGSGASDPLPLDALPPWESFVQELDCVMHDVGSERAVVMVHYDAGPMGMLFAATKPEHTAGLILVNTGARYTADVDYPIGISPERCEEFTGPWPSDEILLSRKVRDLVVGSDLSFDDRGARQLKGIEGD
jgi:pimeloyl-ACP methyl ester carboxylesterase